MKKTLLSMGLAVLFGSSSLNAQTNLTAIPKYTTNQNVPTQYLNAPDVAQLYSEDLQRDKKGKFYRIGVSIFTHITTENSGLWTTLPNGDKVWQLKVKSSGAEALGFLFSKFRIYDNSSMEVFNQSGKRLHDKLTSQDVLEHGQQHIDLCFGEEMLLELREPKGSRHSEILLDEVMYGYRSTGNKIQKDFGESESCEINVNCSEGANWQDEKRGVARILVKDGSDYGWCSGSLVTNTANDCKPLFLTAFHCGVTASTADFNQWKFYFKYESATCANPASQGTLGGTSTTITGSVKLASSSDGGGNSGSDFLLVQLGTVATQATIVTKLKTTAINAYWNGWDANNVTTNAGVGIHHPAGDIKKISAFSANLVSSTWSNVPNTHWQLKWVTTANGHGVTEGGSSGSPLFNYNNGNSRIIGTLTGGGSYCVNTYEGGQLVGGPDFPDMYGKVSYHWQSNTTSGNIPLKNFLDPGNTGLLVMNGSNDPCAAVTPTPPVANFVGTPLTLATGGTVQFTDQSSNAPTSWTWAISPGTAGTTWSYVGGTSATSQNPQVQFNTVGQYTITLTASNANGSDGETKTNYITVTSAAGAPCAATSTSCSNETINNVTLGSINNTTTCSGGYSNYTSISTLLVKGQTYTVSVTPQAQGDVGSAFQGDEIAVYIDWNNNNVFTDAGERVGYVMVGSGSWNNQFQFTVPATAANGTLRMRCRISYNPDEGAIDPCGTTTDGEVEDYSVVVQATNSLDENGVFGNVNIYPNPVNENLTVDLSSVAAEDISVQIFDITGKLLKSVPNQGGIVEIDLSALAGGVYQVVLKTGSVKSIQRIIKQ